MAALASSSPPPVWPKRRPELTPRQREIMGDWYTWWLEHGLRRHGAVLEFSHRYPLRSARPGARTLEIGIGSGGHLAYEDLAQAGEYVGVELRPELASLAQQKDPRVRVAVGDCEQRLDFPDGHFDRVLAIHVLEHLANLPAALAEVHRVLKPDGLFSVVAPCEGGWAYALGRRLTSQRMFERRYGVSYDWLIRYDHVNRYAEIRAELRKRFTVAHAAYFPLRIPSVNLNLVIGLTLHPVRAEAQRPTAEEQVRV